MSVCVRRVRWSARQQRGEMDAHARARGRGICTVCLVSIELLTCGALQTPCCSKAICTVCYERTTNCAVCRYKDRGRGRRRGGRRGPRAALRTLIGPRGSFLARCAIRAPG